VGRPCTVCSHDEAHQINLALIKPGATNRGIARRFSLDDEAVRRHRADHLPKLLVEASQAIKASNADDLLARMQAMIGRLEAFLDRAEADLDSVEFRGLAGEWRKQIELLAKLSGELAQEGAINVHLHPEWLQIKAVLIAALEPHPEARDDVVRALERIGSA
jgi:hypothetical protein